MKFNNIEISEDTILLTRKYFADIQLGCIKDAKQGLVKVNDLDKYTKQREQSYVEYLNGCWDHTFTFIQRAYYIQTGECIPLLK